MTTHAVVPAELTSAADLLAAPVGTVVDGVSRDGHTHRALKINPIAWAVTPPMPLRCAAFTSLPVSAELATLATVWRLALQPIPRSRL